MFHYGSLPKDPPPICIEKSHIALTCKARYSFMQSFPPPPSLLLNFYPFPTCILFPICTCPSNHFQHSFFPFLLVAFTLLNWNICRCFCHKNTIDMGYICSVCLSIFCQHHKKCSTCGWVDTTLRVRLEYLTPFCPFFHCIIRLVRLW